MIALIQRYHVGVLDAKLSTVSDFADSIGALRRATRRVVRTSLGDSTLTTAEVELMMLVHRRPGIGVGEAARVLVTAPNTVSTLVTNLCSSGLVERSADPDDRRAARLHLSSKGKKRVTTLKRRRIEVLEEAFDQLDEDERKALEESIPVMRHLIEHLDTLA
jgi:DNA-binding MarR family transcriptional regulator